MSGRPDAMSMPTSGPVDRTEPTQHPAPRRDRRAGPAWTALTVVEVVLAVLAVLFDLLLPALVLVAMAGLSLLVRREGPSTLGFHRLTHPARQLGQVAAITLGWTTMVFLLVMPVTEHLTGSTQDTSEFAELEGDFPRLLLFIALSWTLAALVEELAFRGYLLTRFTDLIGTSVAARAFSVATIALLFALIHGEQGVTGMVLVFVDAVFYGVLRYAYGSLWAPVVAHGLSNTVGMVAFFLFGPFSALW
ncbi:MAG TPA: CPBP family intramembrane glutamic endopeptidase [Ornithinibacter sp.]|nr:CPBP family intramembrane glutamic endopeptidase [Ornithinibacter sp.]